MWSAHRSLTVPFDYWEEDEKKPSTSTFDWVSGEVRSSFHDSADTVHDTYQSGSGPTRTGHVSTERFLPYASSSTRSLGYWKAEAPSTQVPQPIPYADSPTFQPAGGIMPEMTADAEIKQTITDKDGVAVSNFYRSHVPHVIEWSFGVRHPSGSGSPMGKAHTAGAASGRRVMPASSAPESRGGRSSRDSRARTRV